MFKLFLNLYITAIVLLTAILEVVVLCSTNNFSLQFSFVSPISVLQTALLMWLYYDLDDN